MELRALEKVRIHLCKVWAVTWPAVYHAKVVSNDSCEDKQYGRQIKLMSKNGNEGCLRSLWPMKNMFE